MPELYAVAADEGRDLLDEYEAGRLAVDFDAEPPETVLAWALERWGDRLALCTSFQAEGMVLLDMAWRIRPDVRVFTVDTGRLPQESYDVIEAVRARYGIEVEVVFPDAAQVEAMSRRFGPNLFYRAVPARLFCCNVRKVEPIRRALEGLDAWVTGLRREQWASRANIRKIEIDHDHGGLAKLSPLADWTIEEVWEYVEEHDVPRHPLYARGYSSIGCAPCTRPVAAGEDPRAGRWWWETNAPKECGIHCPIESGGFEHELEALLEGDGEAALAAGFAPHGGSGRDELADAPAPPPRPGRARPLQPLGSGRDRPGAISGSPPRPGRAGPLHSLGPGGSAAGPGRGSAR